ETRPGGTTIDRHQNGVGRLTAGTTAQIDVTNRGGVPANATAVVLNVTAVAPDHAGYLTVHPCGQRTPDASNVNYTPGAVIANAVVAKIGTNGKVCVYTSATTDLVVDVNAAHTGNSGLTSLSPARLYETRPGGTTIDRHQNGVGRLTAGTTAQIDVTNRGGVPANATAVVLNVTAVAPDHAGYLTVHPCGQRTPDASNVNYTPGAVIANAVVAKIGTNGKVCVYTSATTDLVVDVNAAHAPAPAATQGTPATVT